MALLSQFVTDGSCGEPDFSVVVGRTHFGVMRLAVPTYNLGLVLEFVGEVACPVEFTDHLCMESKLARQGDGPCLIISYLHLHISESVEGYFS
ncbi:hypothetical protein [Corynebacterium diphtheriae]|uniref:hypothetical protein n=1 Tax=Corynebacterium diphtheriae TaxID=1717 RepID=UPI0005C51AD2|nr:hypothetical protein [Corynebacterium diphtheriae]CAB0730733.1 hypothetical protein FRC0088_01584 [Corynebacterium diphtheriae]